MSDHLPSKWKVLNKKIHASCRIFDVYKKSMLRDSDSKEGDFFVIETNDWVNVLAITSDKEIILVRQFRYGTEKYSLEPPGGVVEKGEDPIIAGERELEEETGYAGNNPKIIGNVFPNSAIMANRCYFVLVNDVQKVKKVHFDEHEELETVKVPIDDLTYLVQKGDITHSIAINAIFHLQLELNTL